MSAKSKHYGDVYKWLYTTIETSNTYAQLVSCRKLVSNFYKQYLCDSMHEHYDFENLHNYINIRIENLTRA